jgi:spore germination protein YaaH
MTLRRTSALFAALAVVVAASGIVAAPTRAATPRLNREVYAFFLPGARDYMLNVADYSTLSTVAYFGLEALPDGSLRSTDGSGNTTADRRNWDSAWLQEVVAKAHGAGARVVLTVTRFGWSAGTRATSQALLNDPAARARLVTNIVDEVVAKGVDGVNVDFEPMWSEVADEFVSFLRALRSQLDERAPGSSLVFDTTGYASSYPIHDALADGGADAVYIMAYPFLTSHATHTGAIAPMAGPGYDVTDAVDRVVAQTTPGRVILGLPNYGYQWPTQDKSLHAETRNDYSIAGSPGAVQLSRAATLAGRYGRLWDSIELVAWTRWRSRACSSCPLAWHQLYFDNTRSTSIKYDFVNQRDLLGLGVWRLNYGPDRADFYSLMRAKFGP